MKKAIRFGIIALIAVTLTAGGILFLIPQVAAMQYKTSIDLGQKFLSEGKYEEAIIAFDKAIKLDEKPLDGYLGNMEAYRKLDKTKLAIASLKEALLVNDRTPVEEQKIIDEGTNIGKMSDATFDADLAVECYEILVKLDKKNTPLQIALAKAYSLVGDDEKAIAIFAALDKNKKLTEDGMAVYTDILAKTGQQIPSPEANSTANTESLFSSTIKIGVIMPVTGPVAAYGVQSVYGINLFVEEINANGGINGKKIEIIVEDDEADPDKAKSAFKKLATQDKVVAIVGALTSKCSLAITSDAQARKIVMISPSATNDAVTDAGDFIYRACYNDSFQGQVVAQFSKETLGAAKAAILFDNSNGYSKGIAAKFKAKFTELGGTIVAEEAYANGDEDFSAQITKLREQAPDVILVSDYYSTVSVIGKQIRAHGITVPMVGADGWDEITNNAGLEMIDCYYSNHYADDANDLEVTKFVAAYKARYHDETPNALAALAYDAMNILADAIEKGGTDPENLKTAMMDTNKKFITGQIRFNELRNPIKSAVMLKIVQGNDGRLTTQFAGTVNP